MDDAQKGRSFHAPPYSCFGCRAAFRRCLSHHHFYVCCGGTRCKETVREQKGPGFPASAVYRVVCARLSCWRAHAANQRTGFINISSLNALSQKPFASVLEKRLKFPVKVETVGNALNIAHKRDAKDFRDGQTTLLVHVAMGMGASWIIDGIPHRAEHDERMIAHVPTTDGRDGKTTSLLAEVSGYAVLCKLHGIQPDPAGHDFATHFEPDVLAQAISAAREGDPKLTSLFQSAGHKLGHHLFSICAALSPDQVTLAGPVPQIPVYGNAVRAGLTESFERLGFTAPCVTVSPMSFLRATELFALEEFLYGSRLDLKRLLAE